MWLVIAALRRPITVVVLFLWMMIAGLLAVARTPRDVFPDLGLPVIYVTQAWPGMTPAQMEGLIVSKYEEHFLYIAGIEHIESRSVQGVAMMKLFFHPGTDTAYAMAQVAAMCYRAGAFMPEGTVPPFITRLDQGSYSVANLVFESATRTNTEINDLALFRCRPMLATLPGVSAPPPFGGQARTIMVDLDPEKVRRYGISPEEVSLAIARLNVTLPEGAIRLDGKQYITHTNNTAPTPDTLNDSPIRVGPGPSVYLRDIGRARDGGDVLVNLALVNGRRSVYLPVTKHARASTLSVIESLRAKLPDMQAAVPPDISVRLEFDQSIYVRNAIESLSLEAVLGAALTGLVVLLFLRDLRSAIVVVVSIPTSIAMALIALAVTGQTMNLMTLGGLALAVGILVDEATVEIENVHVHLAAGKGAARAVLDAMREVRLPRLVAMLCVVAVFIPAFFMTGASRALFGAMALAVSFAMVSSYVVTSTLLPVISVWFLSSQGAAHEPLAGLRRAYEQLVQRLFRWRYPLILGSLVLSIGGAASVGGALPQELFPPATTNKIQFRVFAPDGTRLEVTERLVQDVLKTCAEVIGPDEVKLTLATLGLTPGNFPANSAFVWNSGPHEGLVLLGLESDPSRSIPRLEDELRRTLAARFPRARFSFEPGDVISQVLNPVPNAVYLVVSGNDHAATRSFAERIRDEVARIPDARDAMIPIPLDYPTVKVDIDRERAAQLGVSAKEIGKSLVEATWTSQFTQIILWAEKTGLAYFVATRFAEEKVDSLEELRNLPVMPIDQDIHGAPRERPYLRDAATVTLTDTPGEFDHWNSIRCFPVTANAGSRDLAGLAREVERAIERAGAPPRPDIKVEFRGQIGQMRETLRSLRQGLLLAVVVIVLLLAGTFQSFRAAFAILLVVPSVVAGSVLVLAMTGSSLNIQSVMGLIMAIGVSVSNGVLIVKFFLDLLRAGTEVTDAAWRAGSARLRPVLMTSLCMLAGMTPMALGLGEAGPQNAPLGRAVVGGLFVSMLATLVVLPALLAVLYRGRSYRNTSLHADDTESPHYEARREARTPQLVAYGKFSSDGTRAYGGAARALDVSRAGFQLRTDEPVGLGDVLQVDFTTRDGALRVPVRVVRVAQVSAYDESSRAPSTEAAPYHEVGCRFEGAAQADVARIHRTFALAAEGRADAENEDPGERGTV